VPLARRPVDDAEVPEEVRVRNWIPAGEEADFEETVERLLGALDADLEWDRAHTRLTVRALEWEQARRDRSFLLRGADLSAAEQWLAAGTGRDPGPTALESEYVLAARAAAARRQRNLVAASVGVAIVSIALLVFALISRSDAIHARDSARAQALTSDAERLGAEALSDPSVDHSLLLAVNAVKLQNRFETRSDLLTTLQQNAALIRLIRPSTADITALATSPDGRLLALGDASGTIRFIDLAAWSTSGAVVRVDAPIGRGALSFSRDGQTLMALAVGGDHSELYAIDVRRRAGRRMLGWNTASPTATSGGFESVAYSPDGRRLALTEVSESENTGPTAVSLVVLDPASGHISWQRRYPLRGEQRDPYVVFTAAGTLLTSAQQGETLLWDAHTGRVIHSFALGGLPALAPDGHTVALGQNSPFAGNQSAAVVLLDLRTGSHTSLLANLPEHWIGSLAFTADGAEIAGAATDGLHVWDRESGKIGESYLTRTGSEALSVLDRSAGILILGQDDGSLAGFDLSGSRRLAREFRWNDPEHTCGHVPCFAVNRQSTLVAAEQSDGTTAIIDLRTVRVLRVLPARDGPSAPALAFMPDGRTLVTGGANGQASFWDVESGRLTRTLHFAEPVFWTAASPDGGLLAVQTAPESGVRNRVQVVRVATGRVIETHELPYGANGVAFSDDGRELVALGCCVNNPASTVVAWDARSGRQLFRLAGGLNADSFAISPDSRMLGVGTQGGRVLLLDPRTGRPAAPPIQVAAGGLVDISFSPDSRALGVGSFDSTASVWDLTSRARIGETFGPYPGTAPAAGFEHNGRFLIDLAANAIEWPMDVATWEQSACRAAGHNLSAAEWRDVLPDRPYVRVCPAAE
jgi:WD40 repeat protein